MRSDFSMGKILIYVKMYILHIKIMNGSNAHNVGAEKYTKTINICFRLLDTLQVLE